MVSTFPLIWKTSCHFTNPLVTQPIVTLKIGINVTFMVQSAGTAKSTIQQVFLFVVIIILLLWDFSPPALADGLFLTWF